ncbi:structural cement protein Gp24 [Lactobacillus xujianguonis]|uniref:structural cement protein Gp24 n=1 Tax=Lactobacillus xujianguonis TaxID=2495899 RepID=UPI000FDB9A48|nr:hypothetical protein [Lactobacillus xujianguonis]RVU73527.1 hypothetical protein EJK20_07790 [Lactobacillus xujianguonis]
MAIPDGTLYGTRELGAGQLATNDDLTNKIFTEQAGGDIDYGQAVVIKDGLVVRANKSHIYGVAIRRRHINGDHLYPDANSMATDHFYQGEWLSILRDGNISVPLSADVNARENAAVDENGNFKVAGAGDKVVGVFLTEGNKGKTAIVSITPQNDTDVVTGSGRTSAYPNGNDVDTTEQDTAPATTTPSTGDNNAGATNTDSNKQGGNK